MIRSCTLKPWQICVPASIKHIIFLAVCSSFKVGGIEEHLMTGPLRGKLTVSFVSYCSPRLRLGEHWGSRGNIFTVALGSKCLLYNPSSWHSKRCCDVTSWNLRTSSYSLEQSLMIVDFILAIFWLLNKFLQLEVHLNTCTTIHSQMFQFTSFISLTFIIRKLRS